MDSGQAEGTALFRSFPFWVSLFSDSYSEALEVLFERLFYPCPAHVRCFAWSKDTFSREESKWRRNVNQPGLPALTRVDVTGYVQEVVSKGINAVNVTGGISHISVVPLGDCLCGSRDTAFVKPAPFNPDSTNPSSRPPSFGSYLSAGDDKKRNFLVGSLFEKVRPTLWPALVKARENSSFLQPRSG